MFQSVRVAAGAWLLAIYDRQSWKKSKVYKIIFFFQDGTWRQVATSRCRWLQSVAATWQPLDQADTCSHLAAACPSSRLPKQPLAQAAACPSSRLQPLAATCSQVVAATCSQLAANWLPEPLAAKWLPSSCLSKQPPSGCKWLTFRKSKCWRLLALWFISFKPWICGIKHDMAIPIFDEWIVQQKLEYQSNLGIWSVNLLEIPIDAFRQFGCSIRKFGSSFPMIFITSVPPIFLNYQPSVTVKMQKKHHLLPTYDWKWGVEVGCSFRPVSPKLVWPVSGCMYDHIWVVERVSSQAKIYDLQVLPRSAILW